MGAVKKKTPCSDCGKLISQGVKTCARCLLARLKDLELRGR
jgi:hypothetical protein